MWHGIHRFLAAPRHGKEQFSLLPPIEVYKARVRRADAKTGTEAEKTDARAGRRYTRLSPLSR